MKIKAFAQRELHTGEIAIHLTNGGIPGEGLAIAKPLVFEAKEPFSYYEPCMHLDITSAQRLMDELWNCGLRPSEGSGSAGQLAAVQKHLDDFRTLAFHALKVPKL